MFLPHGPSVIGTHAASGTISLTGVGQEHVVVRTDCTEGTYVTLDFPGGGQFYACAGERFFRVPTGATEISYAITGDSGTPQRRASISVGEYISYSTIIGS